MVNLILDEREFNVYPGNYTPSPGFVDIGKDMVENIEDAHDIPSIHIKDYKDHYMIEVPLPAIPRENILLSVKNDVLKLVIKYARVHNLMPDPNKNYLCHNIHLNDHIETGLVSASYRNGLLVVYIPKSPFPCTDRQEVVVY